MTPEIEIRRLGEDDVDAIGEIEMTAMPAPWSPAMFAGEIAKPTSVCLGAFESTDRRLVGYVIVSRYVDAWHVMNLVVRGDRLRLGIATALLEEVFERTREEGRRGFTLEVRASNDAALLLYESMGFRAQGVRRGYYTDNHEDAVIMWRDSVSRSAGNTTRVDSSED
jgi:ribosomal-protein-alanine N-acetyltransferase